MSILKILGLVLLVWQPIGRLHQVWYLYLRGVTIHEIFTHSRYRIMLLESGLLGLITPFVNKRWRNKLPAHKQALSQGRTLHIEKRAL